MVIKKSPPTPKIVMFDADAGKKAQAAAGGGYVIRGNYGQSIPIDRNGYYQFAEHKTPVTLLISKNRDDWPAFEIKSMAEGFINSFCKYAILWGNAHHFDLSIRVIDSYVVPGAFSWAPNEAKQLRDRILSDFIAPENNNRPVEQWKGLGHEPIMKSYIPDNGSKG